MVESRRNLVQASFRAPRELLIEFKHILLERGDSQTQVIERCIRDYIERFGAPSPRAAIAASVGKRDITRRVDSLEPPHEVSVTGAAQLAELEQSASSTSDQVDRSSLAGATTGGDRGAALGIYDNAGLVPRYTFDKFVIGNGNQFARAAALAVAERPGKAYNPLFLYSIAGLGKTHLMQAVAHEVSRVQPSLSINYISAERFTNEMINALRTDRMTSFRERYRSTDVLLIDDVQFLAQKERMQEEFFHTFNALHEQEKQIIVASDRPPKELILIESRLRSRFEWGLIADIQPPDLETKIAILHKKAEEMQIILPDDVVAFIAEGVRSNIRELEGALLRLAAWTRQAGTNITFGVAQQCLQQIIETERRTITIGAIQEAVADQFGVRVANLKERNNSRSVVVPRQIAMFISKEMTSASLSEIGRHFGDKPHNTVIHSIARIREQLKLDRDLRRTVNKLREFLAGQI